MARNLRFVHMGLGPMGAKLCKLALEKEGVEIVGAIEKVNLGKDVGEVIGLGKRLGVTLTDDVNVSLAAKLKSIRDTGRTNERRDHCCSSRR